MSVFHRLSPDSIERDFTHYGWLFGCVPVYVSKIGNASPQIAVLNGCPDWLLDVAEEIYLILAQIRRTRDPNYELRIPLAITREIRSGKKS